MRDVAGNYIFSVKDNNYKIMRMGWRQQREFIGKISLALDDYGNMIPFSEGFNEAQDWLLPKIAHVDNGTLQYLSDDYLDDHLDGNTDNPFELANEIFSEGVKVLTENFTQADSPQKNLSQDAEKSLEKTSSQNKLSATLKK